MNCIRPGTLVPLQGMFLTLVTVDTISRFCKRDCLVDANGPMAFRYSVNTSLTPQRKDGHSSKITTCFVA